MTHPTDSLLNEYLDEALDSPARGDVESHLEDCDTCREKLASLQGVARMLAVLPEALLPHDLAPSIRNKLAHRYLGLAWRLALAIQAGFVCGLLLLIAPFAANQLAETVPGLANQALATFLKLPRAITLPPEFPPLWLPKLPAFRFPILATSSNSSLWLTLGIAATLLFIVGNISLLFSKGPGTRK
jgi:anti-sigma factor RsiW